MNLNDKSFKTDGYVLFPNFIGKDLIYLINNELRKSEIIRRELLKRNKVEGNNNGTLHHLICDSIIYIEILNALEKLEEFFLALFESKFILNSFGAVLNGKDKSYVHKMHRDIRFFSDQILMINLIVMLDDFTSMNGATWILPRSHKKPNICKINFDTNSSQVTGKAGDLLIFDSRIFHKAGENKTASSRNCLTLSLTKPFFKQQLDYAFTIINKNKPNQSIFLRQILGYNSRVPRTLNQYYQPLKKRYYKKGQDEHYAKF